MFLLPFIDDDASDNHRWNASLDGRAVHSFLLWVEPHSNAWAQALGGGVAPEAQDRALIGIRSTSVLGIQDPLPPEAVVSPPNGPGIAVLVPSYGVTTRLDPADRSVRTDVRIALEVLQSVGLRYVTDLGIGAVVVAENPLPDGAREVCDLAWLSQVGSDPVTWAEALLREGARSWLGQWLRVEESVGMRSGPLQEADRAWLTSLFADCLAFQLYDRLARGSGVPAPLSAERRAELHDRLQAQRSELPGRLGRTVGMGIISELIGSSYPCWNRRQFAVKSPFDYIREIRPLTDEERSEHLDRWGAPAAVR